MHSVARRPTMKNCVSIILLHGRRGDFPGPDMENVFGLARGYGGALRTEGALMLGYCLCAFRGLIEPYSEGWYRLSSKGVEARKRRFSS